MRGRLLYYIWMGWDWHGMGWDGMVIIGHGSSKSTFGADNSKVTLLITISQSYKVFWRVTYYLFTTSQARPMAVCLSHSSRISHLSQLQEPVKWTVSIHCNALKLRTLCVCDTVHVVVLHEVQGITSSCALCCWVLSDLPSHPGGSLSTGEIIKDFQTNNFIMWGTCAVYIMLL